MEQGINPTELNTKSEYLEGSPSLLDTVNETFKLKKVNPNEYSPLVLAFIGDSVFDVVIKSVMVEMGNCQVNKLQNRTSKIVRATSQAMIVDALKDELSEEEANILRRGRNAKPYTKAKNASYSEYCKATGLEALTGYLFLKNETERLVYLIKTGIEKAGLTFE